MIFNYMDSMQYPDLIWVFIVIYWIAYTLEQIVIRNWKMHE